MSEERQRILAELRLKRQQREEELGRQVEEEREKIRRIAEQDCIEDNGRTRKLAEELRRRSEREAQQEQSRRADTDAKKKTDQADQEALCGIFSTQDVEAIRGCKFPATAQETQAAPKDDDAATEDVEERDQKRPKKDDIKGDREKCRQEEKDRLRKQVQDELQHHKAEVWSRIAEKGVVSREIKVKQEDPGVERQVAAECTVPGRTVAELLTMTNQDIWQHAWDVTWQKADAEGKASDEKLVYAQAQKAWRAWMAERDRLQREKSNTDSKPKAADIMCKKQDSNGAVAASRVAVSEIPVKVQTPEVTRPQEQVSKKQGESKKDHGSKAWSEIKKEAQAKPAEHIDPIAQKYQEAQVLQWRNDPKARADWERLNVDARKRQQAADDVPKSGRDLCAMVKEGCPADQPLSFERLLAACPKGTTVRQLMQALSKEPREFRQNYQGTEFCLRPANSRCVDWLPVQATTTPPEFCEDASLPEDILFAAKYVFEQRLKPQGQASENALVVFLTTPGRLPADTPLPFDEFMKRCPPGTSSTELVRAMSKRRDVFRQNTEGTQFCIKPKFKCQDWGAVNPYMDPTKPQPKAAAPPRTVVQKREEVSDEE